MPQVLTPEPAVDAGEKVRSAIFNMLAKVVGNSSLAHTAANAAGAVVSAAYSLVVTIFSALFSSGAQLAALFLQGLDDVRKNNQEGLNSVIASALADVLGVDVSAGDLPSGGDRAAQLRLFQALGKKVLDTITAAVGGQPTSQPGPGESGAAGFMGMGLNFAAMSGLIGLVSELESLGFIKGFAELGEDLQHSLGIGRLMRLALQPLLHARVTIPYTQEVNKLYTPHQLGVPEYVKAVESGRISEAEFAEAMARLGYSPALVNELRTQHVPRLPAVDVDALIRWGKLDATSGLAVLVAQGMNQAQAQLEIDSLHLKQADAQERAYASEILKLAQNREIDSATFESLLRTLHLSDEEHQGYLNRLGVWLESHHKRLPLAQLLYLAERNLITGDEITAWAEAEGYSPADIATLELWVTGKELDYDAAQKAKAAKAAAAAAKAKGKQPPPPPG